MRLSNQPSRRRGSTVFKSARSRWSWLRKRASGPASVQLGPLRPVPSPVPSSFAAGDDRVHCATLQSEQVVGVGRPALRGDCNGDESYRSGGAWGAAGCVLALRVRRGQPADLLRSAALHHYPRRPSGHTTPLIVGRAWTAGCPTGFAWTLREGLRAPSLRQRVLADRERGEARRRPERLDVGRGRDAVAAWVGAPARARGFVPGPSGSGGGARSACVAADRLGGRAAAAPAAHESASMSAAREGR